MSYVLEVVVDSVDSAINAKKGGADRLELCQNLVIGGTSPSIELFNVIKENVDILINVLLRPRFGDFNYSDFEFEILKREIELFRQGGADGVVIGVLTCDGNLDIERMKILKDSAKDMMVTLHRGFDVTVDPYKTLDDCIKLGIDCVLTSGHKNNAIDGKDLIIALSNSTDKIEIMPGSGVNEEVVKEFLKAKSNIKQFHASGKKVLDSKMKFRHEEVSMGLPLMSEYEIWETDDKKIRRIREVLDNK